MKKYIMSLDQGTTSSRAIIFDKNANIVALSQKEFSQIFPEPGYVEHDPMEIWNTQITVAKEAL
ncbi:MAG: glycerol kinase, partial [Clostridia bacterium]|nr:glycerol kinase [Clostridia bacterium]